MQLNACKEYGVKITGTFTRFLDTGIEFFSDFNAFSISIICISINIRTLCVLYYAN